MKIRDYLDDVYKIDNDVQDSTMEQYHYVVKSYCKFNPSTLDELSRDRFNWWLVHLQREGLSPYTVRQRRTSMLTIWNAAFNSGHIDFEPKRIRKIKVPDNPARAYTNDQLLDLFNNIAKLKGKMPNCSMLKKDYIRTFVRATLDAAMRQQDMHVLEYEQVVLLNGRSTIIQKKTKFARRYHFSEGTMDDIKQSHHGGLLIWPLNRREYLGRVLSRFGVTHTGLRKTAITHQERHQHGTGWIFAGHRSPETTRLWYIDNEMAYEDLFDDSDD